MERFIKENGSLKRTRKIEEEFRSGLMEAGTMGFGGTEWQTAKDASFMLRVMSTKESGPMTKLTDMEFTRISTEADTKDSGFKISSTATELNSGQMVQSMKDNTSKA